MKSCAKQVADALQTLVGLRLSVTANTGDARRFYFGPRHQDSINLSLLHTINLTCPWRFEREGRIITGSGDYYVTPEGGEVVDTHITATLSNIQDINLLELFGQYDSTRAVFVNTSNDLFVEHVATDDFGGMVLSLSGGFRLAVFPSMSRGQAWRLLLPESEGYFAIFDGAPEQLQ